MESGLESPSAQEKRTATVSTSIQNWIITGLELLLQPKTKICPVLLRTHRVT